MSEQSIISKTYTELLTTVRTSYNTLANRFMLKHRFGVGHGYDYSRFRMIHSLERILLREDEYFVELRPQISEKLRILITSLKNDYR